MSVLQTLIVLYLVTGADPKGGQILMVIYMTKDVTIYSSIRMYVKLYKFLYFNPQN